MLVKTFQSASMAEALRMVKEELGPDAMILSTKKDKTRGILGFFSKPVYRVTAAIDPGRKASPPAPVRVPEQYREPPVRERTAKEDLENSMLAPLARELKELRERVEALSRKEDSRKEESCKEEPSVESALQSATQESGFNLKNIPREDLEEIKALLLNTLAKSREGEVRSVQWPDASAAQISEGLSGIELLPEDSPLALELGKSGISTELIRKILDTLNTLPVESGNQTVKTRLSETFARLIKFAGTLKLRKNSPRIIALVGPTGVGKTTTTAKLAAMYALNRGNKVALITMDIFRVGAVEQLKTYSRIMGIPLDVASTPKELEKAVEKHSDCELIFIDTAGRSHKDKEKLDEMKNFLDNKIPIEVYLCLSATTKDRELEEILSRFSIFQISKVVFTKIDESESLGNMVNLLMKDNLQIAYFTTGQRVPEDIEVATSSKLAEMILRGLQMSDIAARGDQADTLREMARTARKAQQADSSNQAGVSDQKGIRVISVTSGKGGVGKSNVVSNLAIALSAQGKKVLIIDADLGLGNLDVLLGLSPVYNLNNVLNGEKSISEILIDGPAGIKIIPAGSGIQEFTSLGQHEKLKLLDELDMLEEKFDIMIVDTEAGISENVTYFAVAAQEIIVVVTPEPTSITDVYALIKLLSSKYSEHHFKVLVNMAKDSEDALEVFRKLANVAGRFLDISLDYLGCVVKDEKVVEAVKRQRAVSELFPDSEAAACFATLAKRVIENTRHTRLKGNIQFFFRRFLDNPAPE